MVVDGQGNPRLGRPLHKSVEHGKQILVDGTVHGVTGTAGARDVAIQVDRKTQGLEPGGGQLGDIGLVVGESGESILFQPIGDVVAAR